MESKMLKQWVFNGDRIRAYRELNHMNHETFANLLNTSSAQIKSWESSAGNLNIRTLLKICNTIGVSPSYFFTESVYHEDKQMQHSKV